MSHSTFELLRREPVAALNLTAEFYRHTVTGARHLHLVVDDPHNAFLVAFLTVPADSTGVAHILEHTALCGSQRYPVRDPFFMMTRRSLATFMNAVTSSDWTAYPFSSLSRKDFDNLMQVYLDAAFFPNLHALDFAQEGCRIELAQPHDLDAPLVYKGVVFNEMKGAMSAPARVLGEAIAHALFPTTTYHYNSGGDPVEIPNLTWEALRAFHARHYHPSNAIFMTFGNIPAAEHQAVFQERVLHTFAPLPTDRLTDLQVPDEHRFHAPVRITAPYAVDGTDEIAEKSYIVLGWLWGHSTNQAELLKAQLLHGVLLNHSGSPLLHALETTELGSAPAPICGLDPSGKEMAFYCGIEGSEPERADAVEQLILDVLQQVATEGVPLSELEAVLHQLELERREISGDGWPYSLHLLFTALTPMLHGGDPIAALDLDALLDQLREEIKDPAFIKNLARTWLLDNPHRVRLVMTPDPHLNARRAEEEASRLAAYKASLDSTALQAIVTATDQLQQHQEKEDDADILPKLQLADVPVDLRIPVGTTDVVGRMPIAWFPCTTNRLVYQQVVLETPELTEDLLDLLPLFSSCLTEVGVGERNYLQTQAWQAAISGGIGAQATVRGGIANTQQLRSVFTLSAKALSRNQDALTQLVWETSQQPRFDEHTRLRELIAQMRASAEQRVTNSGHSLAMSAAAAAISPVAALHDRWGGLVSIARLKALDNALDDPQALAVFAQNLATIQEKMRLAPRQLMVAGEAQDFAVMAASLQARWAEGNATDLLARITSHPLSQPKKVAWNTVTTVHFCAKVYPAVPYTHPDAPPLSVLGPFLKNGFLHKAIRERGGAYGGGATLDADSGTFRFFSYRDPRLAETLADFDRSLQWLAETRHDPEALEQAILNVIGSIDKPGSPAGEARRAFHDALHGRTAAERRLFRSRVLQVTGADLLRVAETYLQPETASMGVVSNATSVARELREGWQIRTL
ncbi:MAG: insulinase family protein [Magnetococcales bacterium]|nr:insulinase family protein [Magnetococcales bacterium]